MSMQIRLTYPGREASASDAFGVFLQALHQTLEEVKARSPEYFEQHALRTSLQPDADHDKLAELIGDAYGVELLFGADPSSLSTVDRLFESRIGAARQSLSAELLNGTGEAEIAAWLAAWSRHHAESHRAERERLAGFPGTDALRSLPSRGLQYHVFGDTGPTVVVVNALGMGLFYWARLIDRLAHDHRIVIWELRTTTGDGRVATVDDQVEDIAAIVEEVAAGPVYLVGWCSGPKLCLRYASAHPDRVAAMVFLAGTYGDPSSETSYQKRLGKVFELLLRSPGMAATVRNMLTDSSSVAAGLSDQSGGDFALEPEILARADPSLQSSLITPYRSDETTLAYATQLLDFWSRSLDAEARAAGSPTLIIGAELDRIASPKLGQEVAKLLPRGRCIEMPGATHYCMYDRPDEVAAMIRNFFASAVM
jgi:pimeloyl-ACP methyl ester carboxylesterase